MHIIIRTLWGLSAIGICYFMFLGASHEVRATVAPIYWIPETGSCSIPEYTNEVACTQVKGEWVETVPEHCSDSQYTNLSACEAPLMRWNTARLEEWHCHDGWKHTGDNEEWCGKWGHQWTRHSGGEGWHCHEEYNKHIENDESTCKYWKHEWTKHERSDGWCEYPDGRRYEWSVPEWQCLDAKRGKWYGTVWEHCADGTGKNRDQCLAVGTWTRVNGYCTDGSSPDIASCNAAAQAQVESGALDAGNYCRIEKGGTKRCSDLNFSWSPFNNYSARAYTTNGAAPYGKYWPSASINSSPGKTYCVDNKCTDVPNPSFSLVKETSYSDLGKLVTFQVKGRTQDFLYYPVSEGLGWDSVSNLQPCECNNHDPYQDCGLDPFGGQGTTNPNDCYDEYTVEEVPSRSIEVTKYDIYKSTTFTLPVEAGCPSPRLVGGGLYACASWKFDRVESSPRGNQCSCDTTTTNSDCKLVFNGNSMPDSSECYDTKRGFDYTQAGYGKRYVRVKKVKRFQIEPFRATPISSDELPAAKSRCFGAFAKTTVEEKTAQITEYTIPVYDYTRAVSATSRAEANDSITCRIKLISQYGRNVDQNGKGYAGEIFQTANFIKAPVVDFFAGSTNTAAPGSTAQAIKVYRKDHAAVTLGWSVSSAEKIRLSGDGLPGSWEEWYNGKPYLQGETTVSNLEYGLHTYRLWAMNARGDQSFASTVTVEVIDPPLQVNFGHLKHFKASGEAEDGVTFWWSVIGAHKIRLECETSWGYYCAGADGKTRGYELTSDDGGLMEGRMFYKVNPNDTAVAFRAYDRDGKNYPDQDKVYGIKEESAVAFCKSKNYTIYNATTWSDCNQKGEGGGPITMAFCGLVVLAKGWLGGDWQAIEGQCRANSNYTIDFVLPLAKIPLGKVSTPSVGSKTTTVIGPGGVSTKSIGDTSALDAAGRGWKMPPLPPSIRDSGLQWPLPSLSNIEPIKRVIHQDSDPFLPGGARRPRESLPIGAVNKQPPELPVGLSSGLQLPSDIASGLSALKPTEKDPLTLSVFQKGGISSDKPAAPPPPAKQKKQSSSGGAATGTGAPPKKNTPPAPDPVPVSQTAEPSFEIEPVEALPKSYFIEREIPPGFEVLDTPPEHYNASIDSGIVLEGAAKLSDGTPLGRYDGWEISRWYSNDDTGVIGVRASAPTGRPVKPAVSPKEYEAYVGTFHVLFLTNGKVVLIPQGPVDTRIMVRP